MRGIHYETMGVFPNEPENLPQFVYHLYQTLMENGWWPVHWMAEVAPDDENYVGIHVVSLPRGSWN